MDSLGVGKAVILPFNNAELPVEHQSASEILYICEKYAMQQCQMDFEVSLANFVK